MSCSLKCFRNKGSRAKLPCRDPNPGTCNEIIFGHFLSNLRLSCVPNIPTKVALADAANAEALGHGQQRSVYSL